MQMTVKCIYMFIHTYTHTDVYDSEMYMYIHTYTHTDLAEAFKDVDDSEAAPSVTIGEALKAADVLRKFVQVCMCVCVCVCVCANALSVG